MPTENRSSDTDQPQIEAASAAMAQIRTMLGREQRPDQVAAALEACDWSDSPIGNKAIVLSAIQVLRATQPNAEPIAWMVGTAFWWTEEEAKRDAAETGLPIIGLGPVVDPSLAERLSAATALVQRMVECAGIQQSVATGYVRDILDLLKGNATPSAPVELQRMTFEYVHEDGERHTVALSREEVAGYMDEFLFEKLTEEICHCEPIGETNVVDCRCDEVAEQFSLVKPF